MKHTYILYTILIIMAGYTHAAAQKIIEGYVFDAENNKPLSGVLIYAKHTVKTVVSDPSGNYRIIIPEKADVLVFSYSGYARKEVNIKANSRVEVGMRSFSSAETQSIVTIGSRDQTKTKGETYVAVDVIAIKEVINEAGYLELPLILNYFSPSFNATKQSGADLADHVDPVSLRGLGPDQILYLINGKPYINSPIINIFGTRGRGNVNTDLNAIPASAIERIEVLRDGAAAQYGSDAIAGVVNIVLKKDKEGTSGRLTYGNNVTGWGSSLNYGNYGKIIPRTIDGAGLEAGITHSFNIYKGNMTITGNYFSKTMTERVSDSVIFPLRYRNYFGDAQRLSQSLYFNGEYPLKKGTIYAFGGYQLRNTNSFNWTVSATDTARNVYEIYPNGYTPQLKTRIDNTVFTTGYRRIVKGWNTDYSLSYGHSDVSIKNVNTINPSLLQQSPTAFYSGHYHYSLMALNMDMNRKFRHVMNGLNLAFGVELKQSRYEILSGDESSWRNYMPIPLILTNPNGTKDTIIKNGTTQGFPGISQADALAVTRMNIGAYGDAELNITKKLGFTGAFRYEQYNDFGGTFGGKVATRYKINPKLSVRLSAQTGFRAPSLAQIYYRSTINDVDASGVSYEKIVANNNSEVAKKLGIPHLKAETSLNIGMGLNYNFNEQLLLSLDAYRIDVKNRIILSSPVEQNNHIIGDYLKSINIRTAQFFINALNTENRGVDIASTYKVNIGENKIKMSLIANFNRMTIPSLSISNKIKETLDEIISKREQLMIKTAAPPFKSHFNINYQNRSHTLNLNLTYFSKVELVPYEENSTTNLVFQPRLVTDFNYIYKFNKNYSICIGANNLFDVYPTIQDPSHTESGGQWESVQQGFGGAFFFTRVIFNF